MNKEPENVFDLLLVDIDIPGGISGVQLAKKKIQKLGNDQVSQL